MTTPTKNATIWYSINGGDYKKYTTSIMQTDACTISVYCTANGLIDSPVMTYEFPFYVNKNTWKLISVDSQQGGNEARYAYDNNPSTFWHTEWGANEPRCPHTIVIDMAQTYNVKAVTYLSRQDGNQNGMVKDYEVYLSQDKDNWGGPAVTGQFKNTTSLQTATLNSPVEARYLKFVAKSEVNGNAWTSAAEIDIEVEPVATAIDQPQVSQPSHPSLPTSHLYDLQGRQQPASHKGLSISNGKKFITK
jgi:beta-galactosidase